jgi:very-short-patch-repair endonuclease
MPLGPWVADFFLPKANLVLECDGVYWHGRPEVVKRDRMKNGWMRRHNYTIVRLTEAEIRQDVSAAVAKIFID